MDLSGANTESMLRYHRFHERFNRSIKMQVIGLGFLADEIDAGTPAATIAQRATARQGLWGGMPDWNAARDDVEFAVRDVGQAGVVRAFAAFDLFMVQLEDEIKGWRLYSGEALPGMKPKTKEEKEKDKVVRLYERLGSDQRRIAHIWPVYRYFRLARDCIAHREGIAAPALVAARGAPELKVVLKHWKAATGELNPPELADVTDGEQIAFSHRQAILASSVLRLVALDLGALVISILGAQGFVYLAAQRIFFGDAPLAAASPKGSMVATFNAVMVDRYRIRAYDETEALRALREIELTKKCSARFAEIARASEQTDEGATVS